MNESKVIDKDVENYIRSKVDIRMKNTFNSEFLDKIQSMEEYAIENYVPIIQKDSLDVILMIIRERKIKRILELGTAIGYSSILFHYSSGCHIDTLERDEIMYSLAKENIKIAGFENSINVIKGEISESMKEIISSGKNYDLIFIDAGKSHYDDYLNWSLEVLDKNGIIICDNVLFDGKVAREEITDKKNRTIIQKMKNFLDRIYNDENLESTLIMNGDGLLIIKRKE